MREINKKEMLSIEGGADPVLVTAVVSAIVTFIVGIFSVYSNPKKFNN